MNQGNDYSYEQVLEETVTNMKIEVVPSKRTSSRKMAIVIAVFLILIVIGCFIYMI